MLNRSKTCCCLIAWAVSAGVAAATEPVLDSAMEQDPLLVVPESNIVFSKKLKPLWSKALAHPEADLQRQVAETIARAHRRGVPGMKDMIGPLTDVLTAEHQRSVVRLSAARTLVVLDARQSAPALFKLLDREPLSFAQIVEPALARWDYKPARKRWLARLGKPNARRGYLRLAIRGLGTLREAEAVEPLWALAKSAGAEAAMRVEAARALAAIRENGLVDRARTLSGDKSPRGLVDRLVAATLLARHSDEAAKRLLLELALDKQPAVAGIALRRLVAIEPLRVVPIAPKLIPNADANVRHLAARALAARPAAESVKLLGPMLDDAHPDVRRYVCKLLHRFATKNALSGPVIAEAMRVMQGDAWRGQEQAALLLGALDHKPATKRLVELLDAPRYEARVASAWALRKLAVPATLPAMLARAMRANKRTEVPPGEGDEQFVQLLQAFGQMKYAPAVDLMWRCFPKIGMLTVRERMAGIWALGFVDVGSKRAELSRRLQARLADVNSLMPEDPDVRRVSAVSLGRIKAKDAVATLRKFYKFDTPQSLVGLACRWAIHNITGETLPGAKRETHKHGNWFLEPLEQPPPPEPSQGG